MSDYKIKIYQIIAGRRGPENMGQLIHALLLDWLGIARPSSMMIALWGYDHE